MTRNLVVFTAFVSLAGCSASSWPDTQFPQSVALERTLFADGSWGGREGCEAIVVELTERSRTRLSDGRILRSEGWHASPIAIGPADHVYAISALGGCNNDGRHPLGDLEGALKRPGAFYKVVNGGEGLAIIVPRAKLAGWFYVG